MGGIQTKTEYDPETFTLDDLHNLGFLERNVDNGDMIRRLESTISEKVNDANTDMSLLRDELAAVTGVGSGYSYMGTIAVSRAIGWYSLGLLVEARKEK